MKKLFVNILLVAVNILIANSNTALATGEEQGKLIYAVINDKTLDNVLQLLSSGKVDINKQDKDGHTVLGSSLRTDQTDMAEILIEHGANVNLLDGKSNYTPLLEAVIRYRYTDLYYNKPIFLNIIKTLLANNAKLEIDGSKKVDNDIKLMINKSHYRHFLMK